MKSVKIISIWTRVLAEVLDGKTASERKRLISKLEEILKLKKKEYLLPKILHNTLEIFTRRKRLELTLARDHSADTVDALKRKLSGYFGKEKIVEVTVDGNIIGGFIAKTEDYIVDASVKKFLNQLHNIYGKN